MDNKEFYAECVKRMYSPMNTKTKRELILIVLQNTFVDVDTMFKTREAIEVLGGKGNALAEAYNFIRDNQDLYVNPQWMNSAQVSAIIEDKNVIHILNSRTFGQEDSQLILEHAIYVAKFNVIKFFMEKDFKPRLDTSFFLEGLTRDSEHLEILQYISSKNIDLSAISFGKLILTATLANNIDGLKEVIKSAPDDLYAIRSSIEQYTEQEYENKSPGIRKRTNFFEVSQKMLPIIQTLLNKISPNVFEKILKTTKTDEMKAFLQNQYLEVSLPNKSASYARMKI